MPRGLGTGTFILKAQLPPSGWESVLEVGGSLLCMGALAQRVWAGALCLLKGRDGLVVGVLPEAINS